MTLDIEAAVLESTGRLEIRNISSLALERGQILVKILYSGVCRSQLMEVRGLRGEDPWRPHLLGHEGSGVVVEVGPEVTKVIPGDEVILTWIKSKGIEGEGAKYESDSGTINSGRVTTFSNYSVVSESRVVKKPENLSLDSAVLYGCAIPTGAGIVINELNVDIESSVVVLGLGGVGFSALLACRALGIQKLIAVDSSDTKLSYAKEAGVKNVINVNDDQFLEKVEKITGVDGADYCIESAGRASTIEHGFSLIRKSGGRLLFASHPPAGEMIKIDPYDLISGKEISGSWGGDAEPDRDIDIIVDLFDRAGVDLTKFITKRYRLRDVNLALDDLEKGNVFRPLIVMEH